MKLVFDASAEKPANGPMEITLGFAGGMPVKFTPADLMAAGAPKTFEVDLPDPPERKKTDPGDGGDKISPPAVKPPQAGCLSRFYAMGITLIALVLFILVLFLAGSLVRTNSSYQGYIEQNCSVPSASTTTAPPGTNK